MDFANESIDQSQTDYKSILQQEEQWIQPVPLPPLPDVRPTSKLAVVTVGVGDRGRELLNISGPSIRAYAERVGADYHEITGPPTIPGFVFWDKFRVEQYFDLYERILYVDADVVVRGTAPDLFASVPSTHVAVHDQTPYMGLAFSWIWKEFEMLCRSQGYLQTLPSGMYNTGFWLASREHRQAFKPMERPFQLTHCAEQIHITMLLHRMGVPVQYMTRQTHWQWWLDKGLKLFPAGQFVHFSGITDHGKRKALMSVAAGSSRTRAAKMTAAPVQFEPVPEPPKKKGCGCREKPASRPVETRNRTANLDRLGRRV